MRTTNSERSISASPRIMDRFDIITFRLIWNRMDEKANEIKID